MDVQTAFLNGEIDQEVYMQLLPGMELLSADPSHIAARGGVNNDNVPMVCRLNKSIYATRQASHV